MLPPTATRRYIGAVVLALLFVLGAVGLAAGSGEGFAAAIPEPAILMLLGFGLIVVAAGSRRRRQNREH